MTTERQSLESEGGSSTCMRCEQSTSELSRRFINRVAWLFYDHEEPNTIAY